MAAAQAKITKDEARPRSQTLRNWTPVGRRLGADRRRRLMGL